MKIEEIMEIQRILEKIKDYVEDCYGYSEVGKYPIFSDEEVFGVRSTIISCGEYENIEMLREEVNNMVHHAINYINELHKWEFSVYGDIRLENVIDNDEYDVLSKFLDGQQNQETMLDKEEQSDEARLQTLLNYKQELLKELAELDKEIAKESTAR